MTIPKAWLDMPTMKKPATSSGLQKRPTFQEVAQLVQPLNTASWLPGFLEWWAQGLRHDRLVDRNRPTKSQTTARLKEVMAAARILQRDVGDPNIRNLLEHSKYPNSIPFQVATLKDLATRAEFVLSSPILRGKGGKGKRGQGLPKVPHVFGAKTLCAARILELCRFLNKHEPGIRSESAAAAAQSFWLASGGSSDGIGNPLNGWKKHFKLAKDHADSIGLKRLIWYRDIEQCHRRGRAPWLGPGT